MAIPSQNILASSARALIDPALQQAARAQVVERLWRRDHTLWKPDPTEIANRLGWLTLPDDMRVHTKDLAELAAAARTERISDVVLLGMGGSSLGPEVLRASFGSHKGMPRLWVLDSTVPAWVRHVSERIRPARTWFLVASKSGGTIEVMSLYAHFRRLIEKTKPNSGGRQFIAITDPGTGLERLARDEGFRKVFSNPSDIGGRYSVLSLFGLVPAALLGIDVTKLLDRAAAMAAQCRDTAVDANPGIQLGAAMGGLAKAGRDKVTIVASRAVDTFGLWAEQLLAESTGKQGTGLIPVAQEPVQSASDYGADRFFVYLRLHGGGDEALDRRMKALAHAGHPVVTFTLRDRYDLAAEFFRWEVATAVAGHLLGIHPFDQPNVQESKDNTGRVLEEYQTTGRLPDQPALSPAQAMRRLSEHIQAGTYLAVLAYTTPAKPLESALRRLRAVLIRRHHVATTCGYGPRYLHSTGQLHKGGAASGVFLELVDRMKPDMNIPGKPYSFGTLALAQATGDLLSLHAHGRPAVRVLLSHDPVATVNALIKSVSPGSAPVRRRA
ncbi:MAG: glucose-6-phosphate isomerase [Nitrospira sp.]